MLSKTPSAMNATTDCAPVYLEGNVAKPSNAFSRTTFSQRIAEVVYTRHAHQINAEIMSTLARTSRGIAHRSAWSSVRALAGFVADRIGLPALQERPLTERHAHAKMTAWRSIVLTHWSLTLVFAIARACRSTVTLDLSLTWIHAHASQSARPKYVPHRLAQLTPMSHSQATAPWIAV